MPVLPEGQPVERTVGQVFPSEQETQDGCGWGYYAIAVVFIGLCQADYRIVNRQSANRPDNR